MAKYSVLIVPNSGPHCQMPNSLVRWDYVGPVIRQPHAVCSRWAAICKTVQLLPRRRRRQQQQQLACICNRTPQNQQQHQKPEFVYEFEKKQKNNQWKQKKKPPPSKASCKKRKIKKKICNHYKTIILLAPLPPLLTSSPRPYPPKQKCLEHKRYSCMKYIYKIIKKIIKK